MTPAQLRLYAAHTEFRAAFQAASDTVPADRDTKVDVARNLMQFLEMWDDALTVSEHGPTDAQVAACHHRGRSIAEQYAAAALQVRAITTGAE